MSNIKNKKTTNIAMLSLMITFVMMATTIPVFGINQFNQNTPATYIVNYIIPSDTSFTVLISLSQTTMNFNPTNGSSKLVEPTGQTRANNTAWANITNTGNINLNFSTNLTTTYPWVVQYVASTSTMADLITMTNTSQSPLGWLNIGPGNTVQLYSTANFTNAPFGTNASMLYINSHT